MKFSTFTKSIALITFLTLNALSHAADVGINASENDIAIHGYDPVSYFAKGKPSKGDSKYSATYKGAIYHFASESNRNKFKTAPEKFAPQFGGYCAMGVALNQKLDIDPTAWHIKNNKLYLNLNAAVQKKWLSDVPSHLNTAYRNWNGIESVSAKVLKEDM